MLISLLALSAPMYRILDLGLPEGAEEVRAVAINNRGEVLVATPIRQVGMNAKGERTFQNGHAFLQRAGRFLDFGEPKPSQFLDPPEAFPTALNDLSMAVGTQGTGSAVFMSGMTDVNPFLWRGKRMDDLGTGWASIPRAINNLGDIVGESQHRGFARVQGKVWSIGTLSHSPARNASDAIAINDRRTILGTSTYGGSPNKPDYDLPSRPFTIDGRRRPLRITSVVLPKGYRRGKGLCLNRAGTILAVAVRERDGAAYPYFVRDGKISSLPMDPTGRTLENAAMNAREDVVATFQRIGDGLSAPALWLHGRSVAFPAFPGWTLQTATGINDKEAICGTGLHEGKTRAFVLMPQ